MKHSDKKTVEIITAPYSVAQKSVPLWHLWHFATDYRMSENPHRTITWTTEQQQSLIDSLLRRSYIPPIVLLEVNSPSNYPLSPNKTVYEVLDGWQRIVAIREFAGNSFQLPQSLKDVPQIAHYVPYVLDNPSTAFGRYVDLPAEIRTFFSDFITLTADIIKDGNNQQITKNIYRYPHPELF